MGLRRYERAVEEAVPPITPKIARFVTICTMTTGHLLNEYSSSVVSQGGGGVLPKTVKNQRLRRKCLHRKELCHLQRRCAGVSRSHLWAIAVGTRGVPARTKAEGKG
jgi:hypothetical protein